MPAKKLKDFLDSHAVKYIVINHSPAFTAQEIAEVAHVPGKELAKTVIVKVDGKMVMVVEPANKRLNFDKLKTLFDGQKVELASEYEFQNKFPDCELGAMPPFGNLFDMEVYVAKELEAAESILFNAGRLSELIRMSYADFKTLVKPMVLKN